MNQRIFELARQAGLYEIVVDRQQGLTHQNRIELPGNTEKPTHSIYPRFLTANEAHDAYQRFAKLLIADACEALQNWKGEPMLRQFFKDDKELDDIFIKGFFTEDLAIDLIREHFGVK